MLDFFSFSKFLTILNLCAALLIGVAIGVYIGYHNGRRSRNHYVEKAYRYATAVEEFGQWCAHMHPAYRLIARQLRAVGEGEALNAGTPAGSEPCTVNGLRTQLERLTNLSKNPEYVINEALQKLRFKIEGMQDQRKNKRGGVDAGAAVITKTDVQDAITSVAQELFINRMIDQHTAAELAIPQDQLHRFDALTLLKRKVERRTGQNFNFMGKRTTYIAKDQVLELIDDALDHASFKQPQNQQGVNHSS